MSNLHVNDNTDIYMCNCINDWQIAGVNLLTFMKYQGLLNTHARRHTHTHI